MITSKQNERVKLARSLYQKKFRDEASLYLVEGVKSVKAALSCAEVVEIFATEKGEKLLSVDRQVTLVSEEVFKSISAESSPQGALALVKKPKAALKSPSGKCLFLDGVADPANVGAIIRTAAAAGYKEIYLASPSADAYGDKAVRASMSGIFFVTVYEGDRSQLLSYIDCKLYAADMEGENVFSFTPSQKYCICIGNEANGVSEEVMARADNVLSIPMDACMESLNAGVSAGIIMYALNKN